MKTKDIKNKNDKAFKTEAENMRAKNFKRMKTIKIINLCISLFFCILVGVLFYKKYDPTFVLIYFAGKNLYDISTKKNSVKHKTFLISLNVAGLFLGFLGAFNFIQQLIY